MVDEVSPAPQEMRLARNEEGEVVIRSDGNHAGRASALPSPEPVDGWQERCRDCILQRSPFRNEEGLVWLDCEKDANLAPLAPLAECGKTGCACTRTLYPRVRTRFREEVVRRTCAARAEGVLPADGRSTRGNARTIDACVAHEVR